MTNGEALRLDLIPCEANDADGSTSRISDEFHGVAVLTIRSIHKESELAQLHENLIHVCFACATKHFNDCYAWQSGIVW